MESIHEGECPPCQQCDYKGTLKSNLKQHMASFFEGECHLCKQCDYKAIQKLNQMKSLVLVFVFKIVATILTKLLFLRNIDY